MEPATLEAQVERLTLEHREERKKVAVLKKAVKTERDEKEQLMQLVRELRDKLGVLECSVAERDSKIKLLQYEKEDLEAEITEEREKFKSLGVSTGLPSSNKNISALEQQNKKLLEEYYNLKELNAKAEEKYKAVVLEKEELQKLLQSQSQLSAGSKSENEAALVKFRHKIESLTNELAEVHKRQFNLSDAKMRLEDEVERLKSNCNHHTTEINELKNTIKDRNEVVASLNERFLNYEQSYSQAVSELMEYKNKAIESKGFIQKYTVVKVSPVVNSICTIFAKKDETGTCYVEIVVKGKTTLLCGSDVREVEMHPVNPIRFYITAILGTKLSKLQFESEEAGEITATLKEFFGWTPRSLSMFEIP